MSNTPELPQGWTQQKLPPAANRRYTFDAYATTRDFLDRLADWSEQQGVYPNLSFGRDYATVTLELQAAAPSAEELAWLQAIDALASDIGTDTGTG